MIHSTPPDRWKSAADQQPGSRPGLLPPALHVLHIRSGAGPRGWLASALGQDGVCRVDLQEAEGIAGGLEFLRRAAFDAVLADDPTEDPNPDRLIEAIRTGSHPRQPILLLGETPDSPRAVEYLKAGADAYLPVCWTTAGELMWHLARAVERKQLTDENLRLRQRDERQRWFEREESVRLIAEQTALAARWRSSNSANLATADHTWLAQELDELLRAYVLMGEGLLTDELSRLTTRLRQAELPLPTVMSVYLGVLRTCLIDLGTRSSRHVLNRGHLLLFQLLLTTTMGIADEALDHHPDLQ